jgi:hypothetical protein
MHKNSRRTVLHLSKCSKNKKRATTEVPRYYLGLAYAREALPAELRQTLAELRRTFAELSASPLVIVAVLISCLAKLRSSTRTVKRGEEGNLRNKEGMKRGE